jgi:acetylglutamate kinase
MQDGEPSYGPVQQSDLERVRILSEALPYLQKFRGRTIVVKYGGAAMKDESLKVGVINDLVLLACVGVKPVLVHGGGPEINSWLAKVGIEPEFKNGLRVTGVLQPCFCSSLSRKCVPWLTCCGVDFATFRRD